MYRGRLEKDLDLWVGQGLVSRDAANAMLKELDTRQTSFSVGNALMMLAALLVSASILLLVASNWEEIPRTVRMIGIVAIIWAFYGLGAWLQSAGHRAIGAAMLVVGTLAFGGGIAMIGQMYHLSGDQADALLLWFAGSALAAFMFRSGALTVVTGFLGLAVYWFTFEDVPYLYFTSLIWQTPLMALVILALVYWTHMPSARHLAYILMLCLIGSIYFDAEDIRTALVIGGIGLVGYLLAAVPQSPLHPFARNAGWAPAFYTAFLALMGLGAIHMEYDATDERLLVGIVSLVFAVLLIALSGKSNAVVRYMGYTVFAGEILYLASETVGSIIGTSGFFLIAGLLVALAAFIVVKLEKRLSGQSTEQGA